MSNNIIYLDANGTTKQNKSSIEATIHWMKSCSNPSTNNILSKSSRKLIEDSKAYILKHCGVNPKNYTVLFTSGGTESNCITIRSIVSEYGLTHKCKPHVIISAIEHNSIIDCCNQLLCNKEIELTMIKPNLCGIINPTHIEKAIKNNTCLISVMYANNEIGSINPIESIGKIAKKHKIPFHSDSVQVFGKYKINMNKLHIDILTASFHKLYCPLGIGLLIINNHLIQSCKFKGLINGSQQYGLRGGTESVQLIGGSIAGMKETFTNRINKNKNLLIMRNYILDQLEKYFKISLYIQKKKSDIVVFGSNIKGEYLENTILLSIVSNKFCNVNFKKDLESYGVIISIGSACQTSSKKASHVIKSLKVSDEIRRGVLRISLGDNNTIKELDKFILIFLLCLNKQIDLKLDNKILNKLSKIKKIKYKC